MSVDDRYTRSAEIYDVLYSEIVDYAAAAERLSLLIRERKPDATTILEAACGTGSFLFHLQGDFDVHGFDLSEDMLAIAGDKVPSAELRQGDMVDFEWNEKFDAVICMFSSIGYLTAAEDLERAYRRFAAHLQPDGVLVVEPWFPPDVWTEGHIGTNRAEGTDITVLRMNSSWLEEDGRVSAMDMHHLVGRPGTVEHFVERHRLRLVTPSEHLAAFAAAGLAMEHDASGLIVERGLYVGGLS